MTLTLLLSAPLSFKLSEQISRAAPPDFLDELKHMSALCICLLQQTRQASEQQAVFKHDGPGHFMHLPIPHTEQRDFSASVVTGCKRTEPSFTALPEALQSPYIYSAACAQAHSQADKNDLGRESRQVPTVVVSCATDQSHPYHSSIRVRP